MPHTASLEPIAREPPTYMLRVHAEGGKFGDPYCGVATATVQDGVAMMRGILFRGKYNRAGRQAMVRALAGIGCHKIVGERIRKGRIYWVTIWTRPCYTAAPT